MHWYETDLFPIESLQLYIYISILYPLSVRSIVDSEPSKLYVTLRQLMNLSEAFLSVYLIFYHLKKLDAQRLIKTYFLNEYINMHKTST